MHLIFQYINEFIAKIAKITRIPIGFIYLLAFGFAAYSTFEPYMGFRIGNLIGPVLWIVGFFILWFRFFRHGIAFLDKRNYFRI